MADSFANLKIAQPRRLRQIYSFQCNLPSNKDHFPWMRADGYQSVSKK